VGSANNQLAEPSDADALAAAEVLYAPDFVVNAGGVINIAEELHGYHRGAGLRQRAPHLRHDPRRHRRRHRLAGHDGEAAETLAERRIAALSQVRLNPYGRDA